MSALPCNWCSLWTAAPARCPAARPCQSLRPAATEPAAQPQPRGDRNPAARSAQINHRADGYYLFGGGGRAPKLNGAPVTRMVRLNDGDRIELRRLTLEFIDRD